MIPVALDHSQHDHGNKAFPETVKLAQLSLGSFCQIAIGNRAMGPRQKVFW